MTRPADRFEPAATMPSTHSWPCCAKCGAAEMTVIRMPSATAAEAKPAVAADAITQYGTGAEARRRAITDALIELGWAGLVRAGKIEAAATRDFPPFVNAAGEPDEDDE